MSRFVSLETSACSAIMARIASRFVAATQLEIIVSTGFNIPQFDTFVAMDWSGATGRYNGIAVAICKTGRSAPRLVEPRGTRFWTREAIAAWLENQLDRGGR